MPAALKLTGERFGRLFVIRRNGSGKFGKNSWECLCECGNRVIVTGGLLRSGKTKSCGCLHSAALSTRNTKHGRSGTREYRIWKGMIERCTNPSQRCFKYYGGRGISVCQEWRTSFGAFYSHIGPIPGPDFQVDRIDNDLGYEPGNVRWATRIEQARNKRKWGTASA